MQAKYAALIFSLCLPFTSSLAHAATCPSAAEIKSPTLSKDWLFYDTEKHQLLTAAERKRYLQAIDEFALAEWQTPRANSKSPSRAIHCYYRSHSGANLEAYAANTHFQPKLSSYWYSVSGNQHCAAGEKRCELLQMVTPGRQYAQK